MKAQDLQSGSVAAPIPQTPLSFAAAPDAERQSTSRLPLRALRTLLSFSRVPVIMLGALAVLHFMSVNSPHPLFCLVQIDGQSMEPTFHAGEQAAFARLPWRKGSIVVADVGEPNLVVKRVITARNGRVYISGDNAEVTETYRIADEDIRAVLLCRMPFSSPVAEESARPVSASRHREPLGHPPGLTAPVWPPRE